MQQMYMRNLLILLFICFSLISITSCSDNKNKYDMSSLNNDMDDESDFEEFIADAKSSARREHFSSAYSYLEKARKLGVSNSELASAKSYINDKKNAYDARIERERQAKLERERQERLARQRQERNDASGDAGGSLNCARVSGDYALWNYCENSSCNGFSANYGLWTLCEKNSANGLSGNYKVWSYLENGQNSFSGTAYRSAEQNKGSFADRKRFIIYYLRGYTYYNY